jgi:hypothetical protein
VEVGNSLQGGAREPIPDQDDPALILGQGYSNRLFDNIDWNDVGYIFGVADPAKIPYPDTYWSFTAGGIDWNWSGQGSPLLKYAALTGSDYQTGSYWEYANHGAGVPGVQDWFGHCPGWTGAAILDNTVVTPVSARISGGQVTGCSFDDPNCVYFEIGDINALAAEVYNDGQSRFLGSRCDIHPYRIARDQFGRVLPDGCKGVNPGALLMILGTRMRLQHLPIAIDAQNAYTTDQIWNQPAYRYGVWRFEPLSESEAANLVGVGSKYGPYSQYLWNDAARGFALIDVGIYWVTEYGPNTQAISGLSSTNLTRMVAVIELDASPYDGNARILGGEYVEDWEVPESNRLSVPPFIWISEAAGEDNFAGHPDGHNPIVRRSVVQGLINLGKGY